jgi:uncharacterized protein YoxC
LITGFDWAIVLDVGVGVGIFVLGVCGGIAMLALARTFARVNKTLDIVDEQVSDLGKPVRDTLAHVGGIADTADEAIARLAGVAKALEDVSATVSQTAKLTQQAVTPTIVNVGATLGGISAGLRRLVRGRSGNGSVEHAEQVD